MGRIAATTLLLIGISIAAGACFGGRGEAVSVSTGSRTIQRSVHRPGVRITSWIGFQRSRSALAADCPRLARCTAVPVHGDHPRVWTLQVVRTLFCSPPRGAYARPAAAGAALRAWVRLIRHDTGSACACPLYTPGHARGVLDGRRIDVEIDYCAACILGRGAGRLVGILMPS